MVTAGATTLGRLSINRLSTAEQVANGLREAIVTGDVPPGTPLREAALAESIGVSRNTIREALRELAREGVVKHSPHRGAVVSQLTENDVRDIFRVRELVELAAIDASRNASEEQLEGLRLAVEAIQSAVDTGNSRAVVDADLGFHEQLVSLLASPRLEGLYQNIKSELRLCLSITDRDPADPALLAAEHQQLLDLLMRGDRRRCRELLREHLVDAKDLVARVIGAQQGRAGPGHVDGERQDAEGRKYTE